jgi:broad specificity phosphatase PhoE
MKYLEVRRHSKRVRSQPHLSQEGVSLARQVGNTMGAFDRVVSSTLPRAFDTVLAMGYAVNMELDQLATFGDAVSAEVDIDASFAEISRAVKRGKHAASYARDMAKLWRELVSLVSDGGSVLIVSHGGVIELGAIGCLPEANHAQWGAAVSYCEGVRLAFDGERFVSAEMLRLPKA